MCRNVIEGCAVANVNMNKGRAKDEQGRNKSVQSVTRVSGRGRVLKRANGCLRGLRTAV